MTVLHLSLWQDTTPTSVTLATTTSLCDSTASLTVQATTPTPCMGQCDSTLTVIGQCDVQYCCMPLHISLWGHVYCTGPHLSLYCMYVHTWQPDALTEPWSCPHSPAMPQCHSFEQSQAVGAHTYTFKKDRQQWNRKDKPQQHTEWLLNTFLISI